MNADATKRTNCAATDVACLRALYNERIEALNPDNSNIVPFCANPKLRKT